MDMQAWLKGLSPDTIGGLYLFHGEEEYVKRQALLRIQHCLIQPVAELMDMQVLPGEEASDSRLLEAASTLPLLSSRRLVVVRDDERLLTNKKGADDARLVRQLQTCTQQGCCLLFYQRGTVAATNGFYKLLQKAGEVVKFDRLDARDAADWLVEMACQAGGKMGAREAVFLADYTGLSLTALEQEVAKLAAYAGEQPISRSDIETLCPPSVELKVYRMIGDLWNGRAQAGLRAYHQMVAEGQPPSMILALIAAQVRLYRLAPTSALPPKETAALLRVRPFVVEQALRGRPRYTPRQLRQATQWCAQADWDIKQGKQKEDAAVEGVVQRLAAWSSRR